MTPTAGHGAPRHSQRPRPRPPPASWSSPGPSSSCRQTPSPITASRGWRRRGRPPRRPRRRVSEKRGTPPPSTPSTRRPRSRRFAATSARTTSGSVRPLPPPRDPSPPSTTPALTRPPWSSTAGRAAEPLGAARRDQGHSTRGMVLGLRLPVGIAVAQLLRRPRSRRPGVPPRLDRPTRSSRRCAGELGPPLPRFRRRLGREAPAGAAAERLLPRLRSQLPRRLSHLHRHARPARRGAGARRPPLPRRR